VTTIGAKVGAKFEIALNQAINLQTIQSSKTFLRWQFNKILLPDFTYNEPKSNGFIQYRIFPKAGLALAHCPALFIKWKHKS